MYTWIANIGMEGTSTILFLLKICSTHLHLSIKAKGNWNCVILNVFSNIWFWDICIYLCGDIFKKLFGTVRASYFSTWCSTPNSWHRSHSSHVHNYPAIIFAFYLLPFLLPSTHKIPLFKFVFLQTLLVIFEWQILFSVIFSAILRLCHDELVVGARWDWNT